MAHEKFRNLEGKWYIKRYIKGFGRGEGSASFAQSNDDKNIFLYEEKLSMTLGCKSYDGAHREYNTISYS